MVGYMGVDMAILKYLIWKNHWDKMLDIHWEDPLKECKPHMWH